MWATASSKAGFLSVSSKRTFRTGTSSPLAHLSRRSKRSAARWCKEAGSSVMPSVSKVKLLMPSKALSSPLCLVPRPCHLATASNATTWTTVSCSSTSAKSLGKAAHYDIACSINYLDPQHNNCAHGHTATRACVPCKAAPAVTYGGSGASYIHSDVGLRPSLTGENEAFCLFFWC